MQPQSIDMLNIDLNCDMGESSSLWLYDIERDIALLPYLSSINIACGFHAGDPDTIQRLIKEASSFDISIGAHPSLEDRDHFGRKEMAVEEKELYRIIYQQLELVSAIALSNGKKIQHVKPHGALYNMAAKDHRMAFIVCSAIHAYDDELIVYGLSRSNLIDAAEAVGLRTCSEVFADRTYQNDGTLTSRSDPNALITEREEAADRVLQMILTGSTTAVDGTRILVRPETICIHGDGDDPMGFAQVITETLKNNGIHISHP